MGKGSAVGKILWNEWRYRVAQLTVVGVVNDYVYGDMYGKPDPVMFYMHAPVHTNKMYLR